MADKEKVVHRALVDAYERNSISVYSIPMKLFFFFAKVVPHDLIMALLKFFK